jgi:hypothetical protein
VFTSLILHSKWPLKSGTTKKITSAQDSEQKILMYFLKNKSA